jgi:hypothetical protein
MIMSVSTLTIGKGAATPVIFVNFSMVRIPAGESRALQETAAGGKAFGRQMTDPRRPASRRVARSKGVRPNVPPRHIEALSAGIAVEPRDAIPISMRPLRRKDDEMSD